MTKDNFHFLKNPILKTNVDTTFEHILFLLTDLESQNDAFAKSMYRKTIIIHTSAIIEALLFYVLDKEFIDKDIQEHYSIWSLSKQHTILYKISDERYVVAGQYTKTKSKITKTKMNLGEIMNFLKSKNYIDEHLYSKLDKVRSLRNQQHISNNANVKSYSKSDLDSTFETAKAVKLWCIEKCT